MQIARRRRIQLAISDGECGRVSHCASEEAAAKAKHAHVCGYSKHSNSYRKPKGNRWRATAGSVALLSYSKQGLKMAEAGCVALLFLL
jgi:hypothetical protein